MIANLKGIYETVEYKDDSFIQLYDNVEYEAYPRHWHTCVEIIMPTKNQMRLEYDGIPVTLHEQDILFICPGALHSLEACVGERYIFQIELSAVTHLKSIESFSTLLYPGILITPAETPDVYDDIHRIMNSIVDEYHSKGIFYEAGIYSLMLEMLVTMRRSPYAAGRQLGVSGSKQKEYLEKFMDVCSFIDEHCTEDLTLEDVADRAGFSKYHFSRLFKQFTSISFYKYLNQKRIEAAEKLLVNPGMSITEVSLSSGFSSMSSFIRMFKLIKGCTPTEYRSLYNL